MTNHKNTAAKNTAAKNTNAAANVNEVIAQLPEAAMEALVETLNKNLKEKLAKEIKAKEEADATELAKQAEMIKRLTAAGITFASPAPAGVPTPAPTGEPRVIPTATPALHPATTMSENDTMRVILREKGILEIVPSDIIPAVQQTIDLNKAKVVDRKGIEEAAANVKTERNCDASLIGLAAGLSGALLSVGYDTLLNDEDLSVGQIAGRAIGAGMGSCFAGYMGASLLDAEDCSMFTIAASGIAVGAGIVAGTEYGRYLRGETKGSIAEGNDATIAALD